MKCPEVSVIMPAYNCAHMIRDSIESVLRQDVDLELIVIDDCSADDLDAVMAQYRENPRVVYVKNEENLGVANTRNKGVAMASAPLIAYLDSDDIWQDGKLRLQLERIESTDAVLCCTARELMTPEGETTGRVIPVRKTIYYRDILKENSICCSSVVIRRKVALEFPMEHADSHEDYITWMRVLQKYEYAVGINEPLLLYRLSTTGKSGNKLHSAAMTFQAYRYMGFGLVKSLGCFSSYALHGVHKYVRSYVNSKK